VINFDSLGNGLDRRLRFVGVFGRKFLSMETHKEKSLTIDGQIAEFCGRFGVRQLNSPMADDQIDEFDEEFGSTKGHL
jgi:hypothetical protein